MALMSVLGIWSPKAQPCPGQDPRSQSLQSTTCGPESCQDPEEGLQDPFPCVHGNSGPYLLKVTQQTGDGLMERTQASWIPGLARHATPLPLVICPLLAPLGAPIILPGTAAAVCLIESQELSRHHLP